MSWRSWLLPKKSIKSRAEKIVRDSRRTARELSGPVGDLGFEIVAAADKCTKATNAILRRNPKLDKGPPETWTAYILVFYEFLYFFTHLTNRCAHQRFGPDKVERIQKELFPLIVEVAVNSWFADWPDEKKSGIRTEFVQNLNVAEMEYARCESFLPNRCPIDYTALCSCLARTILGLAGYDTEAEAHSAGRRALTESVNLSASEILERTDFDSLVRKAGDAISAFDEQQNKRSNARARAVARQLFNDFVDRSQAGEPKTTEFTDSLWPLFQATWRFYREAAVLGALISRGEQNKKWSRLAAEFESIFLPDDPTARKGAARLLAFNAAIEDINSLLADHRAAPHGKDLAIWSKAWFERIGELPHNQTTFVTFGRAVFEFLMLVDQVLNKMEAEGLVP
jgi:hypothetical protein